MTGIIGAMEAEVSALISRIEDPRHTKIGCTEYVCGTLCDKEVVAARCGIGKVCAAVCAQTMILHYGADTVINTGVGGALDTALEIGDVLVATDAVQHDMDTTAVGDPMGLISELGSVSIPLDRELSDTICDTVRRLGYSVHRGRVATGDQFIGTGEKRRQLRRDFGASVCEMEGGAVAQVCAQNGVRCAVVRAVSDTADERASESYSVFTEKAAACMERLICAILPAL